MSRLMAALALHWDRAVRSAALGAMSRVVGGNAACMLPLLEGVRWWMSKREPLTTAVVSGPCTVLAQAGVKACMAMPHAHHMRIYLCAGALSQEHLCCM